MREKLFTRNSNNPILSAKDWPYEVHSVFNAGAAIFKDETILLARCEDYRGISHLTVARSKNGVDGWQIDPSPTILGEPKRFREERWGIEDPRITYVEEENKWYIAYTSFSSEGPLVSLAETEDFKDFKKHGAILLPDNKDAALFPCRFNGQWMMIHRPVSTTSGASNMWISSSPDKLHWGKHNVLIKTSPGGYWDSLRIGLSAQPLKTEDGWLVLYHGVRGTTSGAIYRQGLLLLDLENPKKVLRRSDAWMFGPEENVEIEGDVGNVTFSCGWLLDKKKNKLHMYYGGADTVICLATAPFDRVMDYVRKMPEV